MNCISEVVKGKFMSSGTLIQREKGVACHKHGPINFITLFTVEKRLTFSATFGFDVFPFVVAGVFTFSALRSTHCNEITRKGLVDTGVHFYSLS